MSDSRKGGETVAKWPPVMLAVLPRSRRVGWILDVRAAILSLRDVPNR